MNTSNNFRVFNNALFVYNEPDDNPALDACPPCGFGIPDSLVKRCITTDNLRHMLYHLK